MFEKLKKKLKGVKARIADKIASRPEELVPVEVEPAEGELGPPPEAPGVRPRPEAPEAEVRVAPPKKPEAPAVLPPEKPRKRVHRTVKRLLRRKLTPEDVDDILWDLQVALLESDVAVEVADHIIGRLRSDLVERRIGIKEDPKKLADGLLRQAVREILTTEEEVDLLGVIDSKRTRGEPAVIVFLGINGHGKTTSIAKVARYLTTQGYKVVLAAADTFRAAGIEQLEIHGERLGLEVVKQRRGADAAAVAYDAIAHARAKGANVVLVDTAGRMQTDVNLMDEMRKIVRVAKPDLVIFVGDALTGNDAVEQARTFNQAIGITGSILCKMDADARGGAALSITHVTRKPILFLGTGQGYDDLIEFTPDIILNALLGD
jgi:fused signal recognition particle receptor